MLILICILWLLLPVISFAADKTAIIDCIIDNEQVLYYQFPHSEFEKNNRIDAMSGMSKNNARLIAFDEELLDKPTSYMNAVLSHECSHHKLGHLSTVMSEHITSILNDNKKMLALHLMLEDTADCNSSRNLVNKLGYGKNEFNIIAEHIMEHEFERLGDPNISYDRATDRITNITQCANL